MVSDKDFLLFQVLSIVVLPYRIREIFTLNKWFIPKVLTFGVTAFYLMTEKIPHIILRNVAEFTVLVRIKVIFVQVT